MPMPLDLLQISLAHSFSNAPLSLGFLSGLPDVFGGIIFLVIGILVIAVLIAAAIVLLPAIIVAALVWFLTGSFLFAGIAFLAVAVVWLLALSDD